MALDRDARIAVVGSGALARTLLGGAAACGRTIAGVVSRSPTCPLAADLGVPAVTLSDIDTLKADVLFVCVPDDAIASVTEAMPMHAGQLIAHGSGASTLDVLDAAAHRGALVGSLHPIMVLTDHSSPHRLLASATIAIDGDAPAAAWLTAFATDLGGTPVQVDPARRCQYHAAAALTGGLLTGLLADAAALFDDLGHDGAAALGPMVQQAGVQLVRQGRDGVVMGPVARGDAGTIARHIDMLKTTAPDLVQLYIALVHSCLRHVDLNDDARAAVTAALSRS